MIAPCVRPYCPDIRAMSLLTGFYALVNRARKVKINALDRNGEAFEQEAEGILAVCIQHEIDHLDGKLFVDYLSTLKRQRIKSKLEKEHRQHKTAVSA